MLRKMQKMVASRIIEGEMKWFKGESCGCCFSAFFREACMWAKPPTLPHWLNERVFLQLWEDMLYMFSSLSQNADLQSLDMKIHQHLSNYYYIISYQSPGCCIVSIMTNNFDQLFDIHFSKALCQSRAKVNKCKMWCETRDTCNRYTFLVKTITKN